MLNLNLRELITKIEKEEVEFIQEEVMVQYDQPQQVPLTFKWRDTHCEVLKLLHTFKSMEEHLQYILLTYSGIFCLALENISPKKPPSQKSIPGYNGLYCQICAEKQTKQNGH